MKKVLLATHINPVIHGQAYMADILVKASETWEDVQLKKINTVYGRNRSDLGTFSFKKLIELFKYSWRVRKKVKSHSIDCVILTPSFKVGSIVKDALFCFLGLKKSVKRIGWVHMDPARLQFEQRSFLIKYIVKRYLSGFKFLIACSDSLPALWPAWIKEIVEIKVVSNAINPPARVLPSKRDLADEGKKQEKLKVIYFAALEKGKGWTDLMSAATTILEHRNDVEFHFYGPAVDLSEDVMKADYFTNRVKEKGIYWHGSATEDQKEKVFNDADIIVFPTYTEQLSLSLLEAMYFGKAVIATNVGATKDAISEKELIEPGQVQCLVKALMGLCDHPERIENEGIRNEKIFNERYSMESYSQVWESLLKKSI